VYAIPAHARGEALVHTICQHVADDPTFDEYVRRKYRALADPECGRRYRTRLDYELKVAGVRLEGATVLDAGCGSGIYTMLMLARGAARVWAYDYFEHNVTALQRLASRFSLPIEPVLGDVAHTSCAPGSVGFVYCVEAISHFHDTLGFLRESARVLRPGGRIVIADGNNGANPASRHHIHDDWLRSETGPFTPDRFKPGANLPVLYRRWMIIRHAYPNLPDEDVFQLGMRTAGLGGDELLAACRHFVEDGRLPDHPYTRGMSQRRPEDGQLNEEPLDPLAIASQLRELGIDATARPHFGVSRGIAATTLNQIGAALPHMALHVARTYIVHGRKPTSATPSR
jgi:SAM-dependent methyltransferase